MRMRVLTKLLSGFALGIAAVAGLPGAALARSKSAEDILSKYEKTGESVSCMTLSSVRNTDIVDDYSMLVQSGGNMFLTEFNGRCIGLKSEGRYVHESHTGRMCKGDIIRVLDTLGGFRGSCSLGEFEKLEKIPEPEGGA